jgi:hypothetical protein
MLARRETVPILARTRAIKEPDGTLAGFVGVSIDIANRSAPRRCCAPNATAPSATSTPRGR